MPGARIQSDPPGKPAVANRVLTDAPIGDDVIHTVSTTSSTES